MNNCYIKITNFECAKNLTGARKKEKGIRKKEEGKRNKEEGIGKIENEYD